MKKSFFTFIILLSIASCKKTVEKTTLFSQVIENNSNLGFKVMLFSKNNIRFDFKGTFKIESKSKWDTTFRSEPNLFSPFALDSPLDSAVIVFNDNSRISYSNNYIKGKSCTGEKNILCNNSYAISESNKNEYKIIITEEDRKKAIK